jgi:hypothetical protein
VNLKCQDCGEIFEELEAPTRRESERLSGRATVIREFVVCPRCGGEELEEVTVDRS